ncbi:hypothetical protein HDE_08291 [Halotydeus destructor]|nr:hypothetical protein HDE_08291 [Halotydeus destructor]
MEEQVPSSRIKYLDIILFVFGVKLYIADSVQNFFNIGLRIACIAFFYLNLIVFIVITDHKEDVFLSLAVMFKYIVYIGLHHYVCLKMAEIKTIFDNYDKLVRSFDCYQHSKWSKSENYLKLWLLISFIALATSARIVSFQYKGTDKIEQRNQKENIVNSVLTTILMNLMLTIYNSSWIFGSFLLYTYVYSLTRELTDNYFVLVRQLFPPSNLDTEKSSTVPAEKMCDALQELCEKRTAMQELKRHVNLYLGLLPFAWCVLMYFELSWLIVVFSFSSLISNLLELVHRISFCVYIIIITLYVESIKNFETSHTDNLLGKLKSEAHDDADLVNEKFKLVKNINESQVECPKMLMFLPLGKFMLIVFASLIVPSALAIRLFS